MQNNTKNNSFCLPVVKHTKEEVLHTLKKSNDYQYFEIWLDYLQDIDHAFISELVQNYHGRLLFVFRRKNLETPQMNMAARTSIISLLEKTECFVDLDVVTQQEELGYISENMLQIPLVTSYHNYQETPDDKKLIEIIVLMNRYNPRVIKISTMCQEPKDGLRLLDLLISLQSEQKKYIILGMGEYGTITRVYGALWGNEMNFAPEKESEATAQGQLTHKEMQTVLEILSSKH